MKANHRKAETRALLEAIPDLMFRLNEEGIFLDYKAAQEDNLALPPEAFLNRKITDVLPDELGRQTMQYVQRTLQTGQMQIYEYQLPLPDGSIGHYESRLVVSGEGEVLALIRDITTRKETEQALRESEEQYRTLIEHLQDGIFVVQEANLAFVNQALAEMIGYSVEELTGKPFSKMIAPEDLPYVAENYRRRQAGEDAPREYEFHMLHKDGQTRILVNINAGLISYQGQVASMGTVKDITAQRKLEQQVQSSLERQSRYIQLARAVTQQIATATTLEDLYQRVVTQVKEQFNFYYAQILRYEPELDAMKLVAGYGKIGQQMIGEGYHMPMREGIVGAAGAIGTTLVRPDLTTEPDWQAHPLLPEAKGDIAIPIKEARRDVEAQAIALNSFINRDFDGFFVHAIDSDMIGPIARQAKTEGMSVVALHDLGEENQTASIQGPEQKIGTMLGQQAAQWANHHLSRQQSLKIGLLHFASLPHLAHREKAILEGLQANLKTHFEVVARAAAIDPISAMPIADQWLTEHPDIQMILGVNDGGALGAYRAMSVRGRNDPTQLFIGGVGGVDEALDALQEESIFQATVDYPPREIGILAIRLLVASLTGQPYEKINFITPTLITPDSVEQFIAGRQKDQAEKLQDLPPQPGLKLGLSVLDLNNPFFTAMVEAAQKEANRLKVELVINDPKPVVGVLHVQTDQTDALGQQEQLILEGLSGQIAGAIDNIRLLEEANIFRQFAEASGQGLGMATLEGKAVYMNPTLIQILEEENQQAIIGKHLIAYYSREIQHRLLEEILPTVMEKGYWLGELSMQTVRGNVVPTIQNLFLIHDESGQPRYLANAVTDITERKRAESELEARVRELNALQRLMSREGWESLTVSREETARGYRFDQTGIQPIPSPDMLTADEEMYQRLSPQGKPSSHPLAVHGESIGSLGVYVDPDHPLTEEEQRFLESMAEQVAEALERARLLEQTQKRAVELETVAQVSTVAATTLEVERLLQTVVDLTKRRFGLYHAHIYLLNESGDTLQLVAGAGSVGRRMVSQGWSIPLAHENSLVARTARTRQGVIVNDVRAEPDFLPNPLLPETRSELAVPLIVGETLLGVLDTQANEINRFTEADVRIKTTLGTQVAVALENARLFQQTQQRASREQLLREITARVRGSIDPDVIVRTTARELGQALDRRAFIRLGNEEQLRKGKSYETTGSNDQ